MSLVIGRSYQFGEFTVDGDQKVLLRNGSPLPLAPKVFDTLLILLDNNGRLVEKEELIKRLWPDTFVEESNLTFNIQQVRKILGDNAREPRFIETVAKRGYRFIAEVNRTESAGTSEIETKQYRPRVNKFYLSMGFVGALLLVSSYALVTWFLKSNRIVSGSAPILNSPFKSEKFASSGFVRAVITPNGKYVAYTVETGNKQSIWLRQLETSENIQIVPPTSHQYLGMNVSNDGNSIYFVRRALSDPAVSELFRVMTFGGIPVKVIENTEGTVSLSPDDQKLAFTRCKYQDEDYCSLMLIDNNGSNERRLLTKRRPIRMSDVQFSPDGRSLAFASGESSSGANEFRLMQLDLASGVERQAISKTFFDITGLKWLPNGEELLLAAKETHDGRLRIWHASVQTGEVRPLTNDSIDYSSLSLDKAAGKLLATYSRNNFHLFVGKIDGLFNARNLTMARSGVAVGPDGSIAYEGNDGDIWIMNRDGGERRQLTNDRGSDLAPLISPDGRTIFFASTRSGSSQLWRMNVDGSGQVQITSQVGGHPKYVAPDGQSVIFESTLHQTLWRVATTGSEATEISRIRVSFPAFSRDGKLVAYFFREEGSNRLKIGLMSSETGTVNKKWSLTDNSFQRGRIAWLPDHKSFYFVTNSDGQSLLWRQSIDSDSPEQIGSLGNDQIAALALSPVDGSLAFIRGRWIQEAVLIEGLK